MRRGNLSVRWKWAASQSTPYDPLPSITHYLLSNSRPPPCTPSISLPPSSFDSFIAIVLNGAVPDFRSPGTGLYDNLQKYDLPTPQSIFELSYFRERPDAFYQLAKELWPDNFLPTPTHHFIKLLHTKGLLTRCFTQNIDSLEAAAGIPREMIVAAHGNFDGCRCLVKLARADTLRRLLALPPHWSKCFSQTFSQAPGKSRFLLRCPGKVE